MENLCKHIRTSVNSQSAGYYDQHFKRLYNDDNVERVLTPDEMHRLLRRMKYMAYKIHPVRIDFDGYAVDVDNAIPQYKKDRWAALIAAKSAQQPIQSPAHDKLHKTESTAEQLTTVNEKQIADWLAINAEAVWKWAYPGKPIPSDNIVARVWNEKTVAYLLTHGEDDLFDVAKRTIHYGEDTWATLMGDGDLDLLKWLIADMCNLPPSSLFRIAAENNHVHILQYLADTYGLESAHCVIHCCVSKGHLAALEWALLNGLNYGGVCELAAECGHSHIVSWMMVNELS